MGLTVAGALRTIRFEPIPFKAMRVFTFVVIVSTLGLASASGQSLADVARKETERRQTTAGGGKTYTNKDLKPVPAAPAADDAAKSDAEKPDPAVASADSPKADSKDTPATADKASSGVKDEAYWSQRMAALREQLERDQTFLDALQNRIDALTADFVNRDDPAQRSQVATDRQKALAELDRLRKAIEQDKRAIPDFEEEARRAGVPAGWLR
jgi:hypothetical protein